MDDEIIDTVLAKGIQADARRRHALFGWVVMKDPPDYPGKFTARLVTETQTPYVLVAATLAEIQEALPARLVWLKRQPADPPEVLEIWFPNSRLIYAFSNEPIAQGRSTWAGI